MDVFIFQADIYCRHCGEKMRRDIPVPSGADLGDESTFDSDAYPKGPYGDGGGEADGPQHCGACGIFLNNPLTPDGEEEVLALVEGAGLYQEYGETPSEFAARAVVAGEPTIAEWIAAYDWLFPYQEEEEE